MPDEDAGVDGTPESTSESGSGPTSGSGSRSDAPQPVDPRIRTARPADAAELRELQSHLRRPSVDLLEYGLATGSILVSVADGRVVGYALPVDAPTRTGTHLAELVVAPDRRREGRARGLLDAIVADADGPVTLQAHPENEPARSLYEGVGFSIVERREDAYADGDALLFRLD